MDIKKSINQFLEGKGKNKGRKPEERYSSFDFCYNHFYSFYKQGRLSDMANEKNIQMSCLQLGFYLASWGMMRGSSFLLEKSIRNYITLIQTISKMSPKLWEIDVDTYDDLNIELLLKCKKEIAEALEKEKKPSDTLTTKIMLGIFGNIPAFDQYFRKSFKFHSVNRNSLLRINEFYKDHKEYLDSVNIYTFDFLNGKETDIKYTKAKLIDMAGFMNGQ